MEPKPFEIITKFIPRSTKTALTYEVMQRGELIHCEDCEHYRTNHCFGKFKPCTHDYCSFAARKEENKEVPIAEVVPRWIPVAERLPEYNGVVLVSYYSDIAKMGNEESPVFRRIYETYENGLSSMDGETYRRLMIMPEVTMLWYYPEEKQWSFPDGSDLPEYMTITAWLPIPEPYEVKE